MSIQIDNDLFAGGNRDHDYTGGAAIAFATPRANWIVSPVDGIRQRLNDWLPWSVASDTHATRSTQLGFIAMTPRDLAVSAAQPNDPRVRLGSGRFVGVADRWLQQSE